MRKHLGQRWRFYLLKLSRRNAGRCRRRNRSETCGSRTHKAIDITILPNSAVEVELSNDNGEIETKQSTPSENITKTQVPNLDDPVGKMKRNHHVEC